MALGLTQPLIEISGAPTALQAFTGVPLMYYYNLDFGMNAKMKGSQYSYGLKCQG
jgi:hypothetical protein